MKKISILFCLGLVYTINLYATKLNPDVFQVINLDYPGLETVKQLYNNGKEEEAAKALLTYFRNKTDLSHPDIQLENIRITETEKKWTEEAMEHKFFVHDGYQPSYFYGKDINWQHWPIKDNELRWQLHRTKWWIPMGKTFYQTKNEKYAAEWTYQYMDWIKKNPLEVEKFNNDDPDSNVEAMENVRFAWRPLEVSHRLQDQTILFLLFLNSSHFTPEFLSWFLVNYNTHAHHLINNYSEKGNHLLFEAQRLLYAGTCFPELKDASTWRKSGIDILLREIKEQVYDDGVQYELDLSYHIAAIRIFAKAAKIAEVKGFKQEFPQWYFDTMKKMIAVTIDTNFPDYTLPMFSDARMVNKNYITDNFKEFATLFPEDQQIQYWASGRKQGLPPSHLSTAYKTGGFYIFRNGWQENATQMVVKAGPEAFWHNQPDNGTFELYINGRNFFHDSGSYVYGGDEETLKQREWFRQTKVHNTLTLNNENLTQTNSKLLLWQTTPTQDILVTENQSYPELKHRRTIFFVDKKFFVIVDEAIGEATGNVAIHYNLSEGIINTYPELNRLTTQHKDKNNILLQVFASEKPEIKEEQGWVSYKIRQKTERPAFSFNINKTKTTPIKFVTIIHPIENEASIKNVNVSFNNNDSHEQGLTLKITINNQTHTLSYKL